MREGVILDVERVSSEHPVQEWGKQKVNRAACTGEAETNQEESRGVILSSSLNDWGWRSGMVC